MDDLVNKKINLRFNFLKILYEKAKGKDMSYPCTYFDIGNELNVDKETSAEIYAYLKQEGLVRGSGGFLVALTHIGIKEYESAVTKPQQDTDHFPAGTINYNITVKGNLENSQIQLGTKNSIQKQSITMDNSNDLIELLEEILKNKDDYQLDEVDQEVLVSDIATAKIQLSTPRPKRDIIKSSLNSIKKILENATGTVLATQAVEKLIPFISSFL